MAQDGVDGNSEGHSEDQFKRGIYSEEIAPVLSRRASASAS